MVAIYSNIRINYEIRTEKVRVIDADGKQLGILSVKDAMRIAEEKVLDLVEVAPTSTPPVCRIMDFGKYRYEQTKKEKEARKKQHSIKLKEIKIRPAIEEHDYQVKKNHLLEFLDKGHKVKVVVMFRGRELGHLEFGHKLIERLSEDTKAVGALESQPKAIGKVIVCVFSPLKSK